MKKQIIMKPDFKQLKRLQALVKAFDDIFFIQVDCELTDKEKLEKISNIYQKFGEEYGL